MSKFQTHCGVVKLTYFVYPSIRLFIRCAVKLRRSGRRYQALTPQGSIRRFLLLDVLLDDRQWGFASRPGKITWGPEAATPQRSLNACIGLLTDQSGGNALEAIHPSRNGDLQRVGDQLLSPQMLLDIPDVMRYNPR